VLFPFFIRRITSDESKYNRPIEKWDKTGVLASFPAESVLALAMLSNRANLRSDVGKAARKKGEEELNWQVTPRLIHIYIEALLH